MRKRAQEGPNRVGADNGFSVASDLKFGESMRILIRAVTVVVTSLGFLAIFGVWAFYNIKPTHNPSIQIGDFIKSAGGRWPQSWDEMEKKGFKRPFNKRIEVAWNIDPYELLKNGKVAGEAPNQDISCEVVYLPRQKPDGDVDWLLNPWIAEALRESQRTEQAEPLTH